MSQSDEFENSRLRIAASPRTGNGKRLISNELKNAIVTAIVRYDVSIEAAAKLLAVSTCDMRKSFEGLYGLVRESSPLSGTLFHFISKDRKRAKPSPNLSSTRSGLFSTRSMRCRKAQLAGLIATSSAYGMS